MNSTNRRGDYLLVAACYQAFTLSDGALRMLVLLHLHAEGRTALALALILLPYELAGIVTNLLGGYLGARFGLKMTLVLGLSLQVLACGLLAADPARLTIPFVMATQVLSGIAKDLAKTSAKSFVRVLAPDDQGRGLFRLVALLTGSKNAIKGLGFFVGGALLAAAGFRATNLVLAALLFAAAVLAWWRLPYQPGRRATKLRSVIAHDSDVNWLSAARLFLFGSRDVWFAVALPIFLATRQWSPTWVGAFLSLWVIGYGVVQASAPAIAHPQTPRAGAVATVQWTAMLLIPLAAIYVGLNHGWPAVPTLIAGLLVYGVLFALTSSLHSWLIVALARDDNVAERVGFYYSANAAGRLVGTLASGWLYATQTQASAGLAACIAAAMIAVAVAAACSLPVRATTHASA